MANKSNLLGKVQCDVMGYKIRQMGTIKTGNKDVKMFQHDGTFGVYAGRKKLIEKGFKTIDDAKNFIHKKY